MTKTPGDAAVAQHQTAPADGAPAVRRYSAAGGVVVDEGGERVLVLIRPLRLDANAQPEVRLPKGHVEPGESASQAAMREVCEESGACLIDLVAELGQQRVEFDLPGTHVIRDEWFYLMVRHSLAEDAEPEDQFEPVWLTWDEALERLTFEAEREWLRRARAAL